ncbi:hypothetical protein M3P05_16570 [Sansalvadorimonas sp. 2012CJ34-2]|uniref:Uncharacterized protein n=1 Tax=Parendozoicomonas callyspongiae TaxID=2942213 RepID=A0ABT0PJW8_9GAMM|nr:hypothetical protein [Sansalvadorimonas sp. 2012CJ34-2]MCL6271531.1 hypothetical protein [Sansalvadorimonas sp. 2012CJ34-2]
MSIKSNLITAGVTSGVFMLWNNKSAIDSFASTLWDIGHEKVSTFLGYVTSIPGTFSSFVHNGQMLGLNSLESYIPGAKDILLRRITPISTAETVLTKGQSGIALGTLSIAAIPAVLPIVKYAGTVVCRWWQAGSQNKRVNAILENSKKDDYRAALNRLDACRLALGEHIDAPQKGYRALSERKITALSQWNWKLALFTCVALTPQVSITMAVGLTVAGLVSSALCQWGDRIGNKNMIAMTQKNMASIQTEINRREHEQMLDRLMLGYDQLVREHNQVVGGYNQLVRWYNEDHRAAPIDIV